MDLQRGMEAVYAVQWSASKAKRQHEAGVLDEDISM